MWTNATGASPTARIGIVGPSVYAYSEPISLTAQPTFHAITLTLSPNLDYAYIQLYGQSGSPAEPQQIYFDGLTLVNDARTLDAQPHFADATLKTGTWDGRIFVNTIGNPSAEILAWAVTAQMDQWTQPLIYDTLLSHIIYAAQDPEGQYYYRSTAEHWLQTFWARFGWGGLPLTALWVYKALLIVTLLGVLGAFVAALRTAWTVDWLVVLGLIIPVVTMGFAAFTRGVSSLFVGFWVPGWRYMAPVNLVVVTVLVLGWRMLGGSLSKWLHWHCSPKPILLALICLDGYALYSQWAFYA